MDALCSTLKPNETFLHFLKFYVDKKKSCILWMFSAQYFKTLIRTMHFFKDNKNNLFPAEHNMDITPISCSLTNGRIIEF